MSVIYPGNYVADLNAYRVQGVYALPGIEFYQMRGVALVDGTAAAGELTVNVLSPDKRGDDKPRLDKAMKVPAGSYVYRTAISTVNLTGGNAKYVQVNGLTTANATTEAKQTCTAAGVFAATGDATTFLGLAGNTVSTEASEATITVTNEATLTVTDSDDQAYVIVEVCFYKDAGAPIADDVNVPFKIEAGQGT